MSEPATDNALRQHLDRVVPLKAAQVAAGNVKRFTRERFDEIEPAETEWLVKHFLPAHGVAILYGAPTVGKSFVALYFALRVARGKDILGHRTRKSGVLYIAAEGQNGMRKRIKALRDRFELGPTAFQFIGDGINLLDDAHVDGLCEAAVDAQEEMKQEADLDLGLIVIDTTSASMPGGNENAGEDMSRVLAAGQRIGAAAGALVLFIAHPGKDEGRGVRGWSGQTGNVDAQIYLSVSEDDPKLRLGEVKKLKDGEDGERFAYRLKEIVMGQDAEGDKVTSAYPAFEPPQGTVGKRKLGPALPPGPAFILRTVRQMMDAGQTCLVPSVPHVPGLKSGTSGVRRADLRDCLIQTGYADPTDKPDTVKRSVNRDLLKLIDAMEVRSAGELIWLAK